MANKRIVFLTGTRADFGKLKSLMSITQNSTDFDVHIFATGMHMNSKYGKTVEEIYKSGFNNIYMYINHDDIGHMDRILANTINGFSHYIAEIKPDLIVVHGDRVEALAGAIVGSLNNILVAHVEGGEVSGTIDELIRHSVSKLSHIHLVSNNEANTRLIQMGEHKNTIFTVGSPDLDLMNPDRLCDLDKVKEYYSIEFSEYAILMFHPVTTEFDHIHDHAKSVVESALLSEKNYIVIYPNNDIGSDEILTEYSVFKNNDRFRVFPSIRFEYFLSLLKGAEFILGNSSAGVREAPYYSIPAIDVGSRQKNRSNSQSIVHADYDKDSILRAIDIALKLDCRATVNHCEFGDGKSALHFYELLQEGAMWDINVQKQFQDLK